MLQAGKLTERIAPAHGDWWAAAAHRQQQAADEEEEVEEITVPRRANLPLRCPRPPLPRPPPETGSAAHPPR